MSSHSLSDLTDSGENVSEGDVLVFKPHLTELHSEESSEVSGEMALAAVKLEESKPSCIIGLVSASYKCSYDLQIINRFAEVVEVYQESENLSKKRKSERVHGLLVFKLI